MAFVLLIGLLAVAVVGRLILERRLALGPTPTITRARMNTDSPTQDFRATRNLADLITQMAYNAADIGIITPTRDVTVTPTATGTSAQPSPTIEPTRGPTRISTIFAPIIGVDDPGTATPAVTATPTVISGGLDVETPTPRPGAATQTAIARATATALLFTPTASPTPVDTATPTETPTRPIVGAPPVSTLQAVTKSALPVYAGPSVLYSHVTTLSQGVTVRLEGRTISGEWVRVCCTDDSNVYGWARQAYFSIAGNTPPDGAPSDAKGGDVRWLALQQTDTIPLTPQTTATVIPDADYPLLRRDSEGTGRVDTQFRTPLRNGWPSNNQATGGGGFTSPPVVVGSVVIAANADSHLYGFDKTIGNQRFKINLNAVVKYAPAVQNPYIYVVDQTGEVASLRDTGSDAEVWRKSLGTPANAAINIRGDTLFVAGSDHILYALDRLNDGNERWRFSAPQGARLQYPVIGDQLIYVGDARLSALDVYSGTVIWEDSTMNGVAGPPVYARPGINGLAEVYAVDIDGVIHAFDANTGSAYWRKGTSDRPTSLAVDETRLYAAGPGFVSAHARRTGDPLWRIDFGADEILGGPIVGNGRILVAGSSGAAQILDASTGGIVGAAPTTESLAGQPAVSDGWIFLAARNGRLYAMKESN